MTSATMISWEDSLVNDGQVSTLFVSRKIRRESCQTSFLVKN